MSHAILSYNKGRENGLADGVVITPSHNPPEDGGFKYNPPNGGPADTDITGGDRDAPPTAFWKTASRASSASLTTARANRPACIATTISGPMSPISPTSSTWKRSAAPASKSASIRWAARRCITGSRSSSATAGRDHRQRRGRSDVPLHDGGLGRQNPDGLLVALCDGAADRPARQIRRRLRQRHRRRPARHRDAERPDESEPLSRRRDLLFVHTTRRNGAATARSARPSSAAASSTASRKSSAAGWSKSRSASNGSSTACIDGTFGFAGEESAGASFLRRDGSVWTTDKDGIILGLLAAEITARTERDPEPVVRRADQ